MSRDRRRRALKRGRGGEALAAMWLRLKGYRILARAYRTAVGEIDLVARRGRVVAFVEVKARPDTATAAESIGARQRRRVARAAALFVQRNPTLAGLDVRFDAVLIAPRRRPRHIIDAWRDTEVRDIR